MRQSDDRGCRDGWTLVADYEAVRGMVVGSVVLTTPVMGLALLRRGGMAAWMQAAGCVSTPSSCGSRRPTPAWHTQGPVAEPVTPELVTILTQVALAAGVPPARMEETRR